MPMAKTLMRHSTFLVFLLVAAAFPVYGQKCLLDRDGAPRFAGYRLGQTFDDVTSRIQNGNTRVTGRFAEISGEQNPSSATLQTSARRVQWEFLNLKIAKLSAIYVGYQPKTIDAFLADFAGPANIPTAAFKRVSATEATVKCDGFSVTLELRKAATSGVLLPVASMVDLKAGRPGDRSAFEEQVEKGADEREELRKRPKEKVSPRGAEVGPVFNKEPGLRTKPNK